MLVGDADFIPFRYQGQYACLETNLYYNRFRHYDPEMGQYIQQDPIGIAGNNPTLYGYVHNPNGWVDPWGLSVCKPIGTKSSSLPVPYDGNYAARQILNSPTNITPGGRTITAHAAERMANPPVGRAPTSMRDIDHFLDTVTEIRKITPHPLGDTITLRNANSTIKEVVVDAATGLRIITVINPK